MIRSYAQVGLIRAPLRTEAGYRVYSDPDIHALRFIRRARDLGFTVEQIGELVQLWQDRSRASADVKHIALQHVAVLEAKMHEIEEMAHALKHLAANCHGDDRPDCPIIEELAHGHCGSSHTGHLGKGFEKLR
jgi:Cu(I)-responsive transcriptional regulator